MREAFQTLVDYAGNPEKAEREVGIVLIWHGVHSKNQIRILPSPHTEVQQRPILPNDCKSPRHRKPYGLMFKRHTRCAQSPT